MARVKYSVEQIIQKLREAEVLLGQGQTVKDICRKLGITEPITIRVYLIGFFKGRAIICTNTPRRTSTGSVNIAESIAVAIHLSIRATGGINYLTT